MDIATSANNGDVIGVQVASRPKLLRSFWIVEIALREPGGTQYDLSGRQAVVGDIVHVLVNNAQVDQRRRHSGLGPKFHLQIRVAAEIPRHHMGDRGNRSGFRHPVACKNVDASGKRLLGKCFRQRRTTHDHLQTHKIGVGRCSGVQQHLQDGGNAVGKRDAFALDQLDEHRRLIASWIDLLDARQRGGPGKSPPVHMEHWCDRHIHVVTREPALLACQAKERQFAQRMQHELPVAVIDPFW